MWFKDFEFMVDKHEGMPKILDNGVASASAQMSAFLQFSIQVTTACTYSMAYSVPASDSESNSFRVPWEASHVTMPHRRPRRPTAVR